MRNVSAMSTLKGHRVIPYSAVLNQDGVPGAAGISERALAAVLTWLARVALVICAMIPTPRQRMNCDVGECGVHACTNLPAMSRGTPLATNVGYHM